MYFKRCIIVYIYTFTLDKSEVLKYNIEITAVADLSIFVLRADMLDKKILPQVENLYKAGKYNHMALILNGVDMQYKKYGYGSRGRFGYGYGYGE